MSPRNFPDVLLSLKITLCIIPCVRFDTIYLKTSYECFISNTLQSKQYHYAFSHFGYSYPISYIIFLERCDGCDVIKLNLLLEHDTAGLLVLKYLNDWDGLKDLYKWIHQYSFKIYKESMFYCHFLLKRNIKVSWRKRKTIWIVVRQILVILQ